MPTNKLLYTLSSDKHETIIDALQKREDVYAITDWKIKLKLK